MLPLELSRLIGNNFIKLEMAGKSLEEQIRPTITDRADKNLKKKDISHQLSRFWLLLRMRINLTGNVKRT
jgi:hypothetical protein